VRDLWAYADLGTFTDTYTAATVPSHGVVMLKVTSVAAEDVTASTPSRLRRRGLHAATATRTSEVGLTRFRGRC